jgi:dihydropteroate synthase
MELIARHRHIAFPRRPLIMGILNINDDSFCRDGSLDPDWAKARAREMISQGADIIDIGGESARTNRSPVEPEEELRRLGPVITGFKEIWETATPRDAEQLFPPLLSINTWRPEVAQGALRLGGDLLNDLGALPDERNARICADTGAALLIMHSKGAPKVAHTHVAYDDVMAELITFFEEKIALACAAGMDRSALMLDPGIDFAKQAADNLRIYQDLNSLHVFQRPILLPVSRKSVIGRVLGISDPQDRDPATAASIVAGMLRHANIFRVHNVKMAYQTITTIHRLQSAP